MSQTRFADRMRHVGFSSSQAIINKVRELREQGIDVINFGSKPETPQHVKDAAIKMLETPAAASYTDARGLPELREAIAAKLAHRNGVRVDPDTEIVTTIGGKQGIFVALLGLVDRGDEVLLDDPGWLSFEPMVRLVGATPVPLPLIEADGFRFRLDSLRERITPATKLIVLCNPHNPTGRVLERADLEAIADVALEHDLLVLMDEAYEDFTYDGLEHVSMAALDDMRSRTITVQTVSKIYNMFGWRVGWLTADAEVVSPILAAHSHTVTCPTSFAQAGAAAALTDALGQGGLRIPEIVQRYAEQRTVLVEGLRRISGVTCQMPKGAYFAFPNIERFGMSSAELCHHLLDRGRVATTPGSAFGAQGEGHLRVVFNSPVEEIERGVRRIADVLSQLQPAAAD